MKLDGIQNASQRRFLGSIFEQLSTALAEGRLASIQVTGIVTNQNDDNCCVVSAACCAGTCGDGTDDYGHTVSQVFSLPTAASLGVVPR